jgi:hypothetical protein
MPKRSKELPKPCKKRSMKYQLRSTSKPALLPHILGKNRQAELMSRRVKL